MTSRRHFIAIVPFAGAAVLAQSQGAPLDPKDPQATALGYVADATKADKAKYPKYAAGQTCATCQLYLGKADAATAPCGLFQNKLVPKQAWCSAWVKKA